MLIRLVEWEFGQPSGPSRAVMFSLLDRLEHRKDKNPSSYVPAVGRVIYFCKLPLCGLWMCRKCKSKTASEVPSSFLCLLGNAAIHLQPDKNQVQANTFRALGCLLQFISLENLGNYLCSSLPVRWPTRFLFLSIFP